MVEASQDGYLAFTSELVEFSNEIGGGISTSILGTHTESDLMADSMFSNPTPLIFFGMQ